MERRIYVWSKDYEAAVLVLDRTGCPKRPHTHCESRGDYSSSKRTVVSRVRTEDR